MLDFGTTETKYLEFTVGGRKVYKLPLMVSMPMSVNIRFAEVAQAPRELQGTEALKLQMELLRGCMGDAADALTVGQVNGIFTAWMDANNAEEPDPGK